uniref:Putative secreted protein n=1 Tax=Ixodes ricinus TaxID=34613 RepID=A0A147BUY7_IXORI
MSRLYLQLYFLLVWNTACTELPTRLLLFSRTTSISCFLLSSVPKPFPRIWGTCTSFKRRGIPWPRPLSFNASPCKRRFV